MKSYSVRVSSVNFSRDPVARRASLDSVLTMVCSVVFIQLRGMLYQVEKYTKFYNITMSIHKVLQRFLEQSDLQCSKTSLKTFCLAFIGLYLKIWRMTSPIKSYRPQSTTTPWSVGKVDTFLSPYFQHFSNHSPFYLFFLHLSYFFS